MERQEYKVDGFILLAQVCTESEVISDDSIDAAFDIFMDDDTDSRLGIIVQKHGTYKVFSDYETRNYSSMQSAVRRVWELFNTEDNESEIDDEWSDINAELNRLGHL